MNTLKISLYICMVLFLGFSCHVLSAEVEQRYSPPPGSQHRSPTVSRTHASAVELSESKTIIEKEISELEQFLGALKAGDEFSSRAKVPSEQQLKDLKALREVIKSTTPPEEVKRKIRYIRNKYHPQDDE